MVCSRLQGGGEFPLPPLDALHKLPCLLESLTTSSSLKSPWLSLSCVFSAAFAFFVLHPWGFRRWRLAENHCSVFYTRVGGSIGDRLQHIVRNVRNPSHLECESFLCERSFSRVESPGTILLTMHLSLMGATNTVTDHVSFFALAARKLRGKCGLIWMETL